MPTIEVRRDDLEGLIGKKASSIDELEEWLMWAKAELDGVENNILKVDVKDTNRPDLWSVEGIAREIKGRLKIERGLPQYRVESGDVEVFVDKKLKDIRPAIACAIVKGVDLDDEAIRQLMQLQEKIHHTFGRRREYVAIGVSNFDKISPPVYYKAVKPKEIKFPPLGYDEEMTPAEILEKHPKGQEYGHLINEFSRYPILVDSKGEVISMPPIINSNTIGKVDEHTKNLFIDVTGLRHEDVLTALNVMVTVLADRGGKTCSVAIHTPDGDIPTPDLTPREVVVDANKIREILGIEISNHEIVELLKDARYDAEVATDGRIVARYLPTRSDILHWRDVAEDVAISFGYNDFLPEEVRIGTTGELSRRELLSDKIRELMIGYGLQEVMTFTLTNKDVLFKKMNRKEDDVVEIANPVSSSWTTIRNAILPCLIEFLSRNTHVEYPQRVFEVGEVVVIDPGNEESGTRTKRHLAIAIASSTASFTEIKEIVDSFAKQLKLSFDYEETEDGALLEGRRAAIMLEGKRIGVMGEVHPAVLNNWDIEMPVVAAEIDLEEIFRALT